MLDTCDIVVDVGSVYDESKQRFDHHQRGFTEVFGHGFETKLSSAGLVYKLVNIISAWHPFTEARYDASRHFGKEIIANKTQAAIDDPQVTTLWLKLYREFIEAIDGIDNGVSQYPADLQPKYKNHTDLSARVRWLNPAWNQSTDSAIVDVISKAESIGTHF